MSDLNGEWIERAANVVSSDGDNRLSRTGKLRYDKLQLELLRSCICAGIA